MNSGMIIFLTIAVIAVAVYVAVKKQKKLMDEGRMIRRSASFYEYSETFTLSGADFETVVRAVQAADFSGSGASVTKSDSAKAIGFKGPTWKAELYKKDNDGDRDVYYFHFTKWSSRNGTPYGLMGMNVLLTAVENMFLSIDGNAGVVTAPIKVKSTPSIF